ncbi:MAG: hypothetical protein V9E85_10050 [Candidatus Nanopelagicales bacterium]
MPRDKTPAHDQLISAGQTCTASAVSTASSGKDNREQSAQHLDEVDDRG